MNKYEIYGKRIPNTSLVSIFTALKKEFNLPMSEMKQICENLTIVTPLEIGGKKAWTEEQTEKWVTIFESAFNVWTKIVEYPQEQQAKQDSYQKFKAEWYDKLTPAEQKKVDEWVQMNQVYPTAT